MRRLYDIANVLASIGLIRKIRGSKVHGEMKDPSFEWIGPPPLDIFHGINDELSPPLLPITQPQPHFQSNQPVTWAQDHNQFKYQKIVKDEEDFKDVFFQLPPILSRTGTVSSINSFMSNTPFSPTFFNSQTSELTPPEELELQTDMTPYATKSSDEENQLSNIESYNVAGLLSPPHSARQPNTRGGGGSHHNNTASGIFNVNDTARSTSGGNKSIACNNCDQQMKLNDHEWPTPCDDDETVNLPLPPNKMLEFQVERLRKFMDDYQDRWFECHPDVEGQDMFDNQETTTEETQVTESVGRGVRTGVSEEESPPLFTKLSDVSPRDQATAGIIKCDIECEEY